MDRLLNNVTRKGGTIGAGGGVNVGGNVNVGGGSNASTAAAAAAGASIGSGGGLTATQQLRQKQKSHYSAYRQAMQARKLFMSNLYASFIRPPIRFGNAFPPATGNPLTDFFRQGGPLSKAFGAIGNSVVKYMVGPLMQMHKAIGNYFIHPLYNLITGKLNITRTIGAQLPLLGKVSSLYLAKWFAPGDMKSGMGRAIAALSFLPGMSRVAAVFSKFGILGVSVAAAFIALLAATYALIKGIKAGAEAYENAAKLGKGVAQTSQHL